MFKGQLTKLYQRLAEQQEHAEFGGYVPHDRHLINETKKQIQWAERPLHQRFTMRVRGLGPADEVVQESRIYTPPTTGRKL